MVNIPSLANGAMNAYSQYKVNRRKAVLVISIALSSLFLVFVIFWFSRPLVVFEVGNAYPPYVRKLGIPFLSAYYRTRIESVEGGDGDIVISLSSPMDGAYPFPSDPEFLFDFILDESNVDVCHLFYDELSEREATYIRHVKEKYPFVRLVPFQGSLERSYFEIERGHLSDGDVLIALDYSKIAEFVRSLDFPVRIVIDYLDAAALEASVKPWRVARPRWDEYILPLLSNVKEG